LKNIQMKEVEMKKKSLIAVLSIMFSLGLIGQAMATYSISGMYVQHRHSEDGQDSYRFYVEFRDDATKQFATEDLLQSITLLDPNGNPVDLSSLKFAFDHNLDGEYDGKSGRWTFGHFDPLTNLWVAAPYTYGYYYSTITGPLVRGTYQLTATYDGIESQFNFTCNGLVDLPVIPSSSIRLRWDKGFGDLICTWAIPVNLSRSSPNLQTSVRASINLYTKDSNGKDIVAGYITVRVPTHMGFLLFPTSAMDLVSEMLGNVKVSKSDIRIQLRTNDNNNRAYSKAKTIPPQPKKK
jgi:hypothetical protein